MARLEGDRRPARVTPFGRLEEIGFIRARLDEANGNPGVVLVGGSAGAGKSSLLVVVRQALQDDAEVLVAACVEGGADFAAARDLFGTAADDVLTSTQDDYSRLHGLHRIATGLADQRPLVLALDDAHLCDPGTARWLGFVARRAERRPIWVVLTYSCPDRLRVEALFSELTSALDVFETELGPFADEDLREQITRGFGVPPHDDFVAACREVCGTTPADTRWWLDRLADQGVSPDAVGAAHLRAEGKVVDEQSCWSWFEQQADPEVRRYATAVAVLGSAEPNAAAALFGLSLSKAESARRTLTEAGLLTGEGRIRMPSVRDLLLDRLDPEELRTLRTRGARLLCDEKWAHTDVADLLMTLPGLDEVWMFCALREAARDTTVPTAAASAYLRRVLHVVPGHVDTQLELATVLGGTDPAAAMNLYAEVLPRMQDVVARATVAAQYAVAAFRSGRSAEAYPVLAEALADLPADADPALRSQVEMLFLAAGLHELTTVEQTLAYARRITLPADLRSPDNKRLGQQVARAEVLAGRSVDAALTLTRRMLPSAGGPYAWGDVVSVHALYLCGERTEALALLEHQVAGSAARGDGLTQVIALSLRAALKLDDGELNEAQADAERALSTPMDCGPLMEDIFTRTVLGSVLARRGENDAAEQVFEQDETTRNPEWYGLRMTGRARLLRNRGDRDAALEVLLRCGRELHSMGVRNPVLVPWWVDAVTLLVEAGRTDEARELAERFRVATAGWDIARARGYALLAEGLVTGGAETFERAVAELSTAGARLYECQALTALGAALVRDGDDRAARKHLRTAVDIAMRSGDVPSANVARTMLVDAGGRMGALSESLSGTLTSGERRVAALAVEGMTNREIADALFVTVRTVESHLSNAYRKLGVQTRAELADQLR